MSTSEKNQLKHILKQLPPDLRKRLFDLWYVPQRPDYHPEGNTLKHTLTVIKRALKDGDADIIAAAIFHDLGKKDTLRFKTTKTGETIPTAYGHEAVSARLVKQYRNIIKQMGANPVIVYWLVKNHMRIKQYDKMREFKKRLLDTNPNFNKLKRFTSIDRGGLDENTIKFDNWIIPPDDVLKREFYVEHELKRRNFFKNFDEFYDAVKNGKIVTVTPEFDKKIGNRSRTKTYDDLLSLIKTYRSYPQYRNEKTLKALYDAFRKNKPMELPIVLDFGNGHYFMFSGNTRMDVAFQLGINPKVLLAKVSNSGSGH